MDYSDIALCAFIVTAGLAMIMPVGLYLLYDVVTPEPEYEQEPWAYEPYEPEGFEI